VVAAPPHVSLLIVVAVGVTWQRNPNVLYTLNGDVLAGGGQSHVDSLMGI
jgi:hypothetical protein